MASPESLGPEELGRVTYKWERLRSLLVGVLEVVWQPGASVALLVAIRVFDGGTLAKGVISASNFMGFLLAPFTLGLLARLGRPLTRNMAFLYAACGLILLAAAFAPTLTPYVVLVSLAHIVLMQHLPLNTEMYGTHFTTSHRGHRISTAFLIAGSVSAVTSLITGRLLDANLDRFRLVFSLAAFCALGAAACLLRIPSRPLDAKRVGHPLRNLALVAHDRLFAWMLASWMLLGFGNLMTLPLRIDYMANPRYGIDASNQTILLVTGVVPLVTRLIMSRFLGRQFDRMNLVTLRMGLNGLLLSSMLMFFLTRNVWVMGLGMALLGTGMAGGRIVWMLWVTKLSPPSQTSAYMSVHMMSTGLRGSIAPFAGFALANHFPLMHIALLGSALTLISTAMFLPARKHIFARGRELSAAGG